MNFNMLARVIINEERDNPVGTKIEVGFEGLHDRLVRAFKSISGLTPPSTSSPDDHYIWHAAGPDGRLWVKAGVRIAADNCLGWGCTNCAADEVNTDAIIAPADLNDFDGFCAGCAQDAGIPLPPEIALPIDKIVKVDEVAEPEKKPAKIAKHRDENHPGKWWLTDFTMEQVEGRLAHLEAEVTRLRKERDEWKAKAACDACAGEGVAASGPCMCKGSGLASDAVCTLREQLFKAEKEVKDERRFAAAYMLNKADGQPTDSGFWLAIADAAFGVARGEHRKDADYGSFDEDLLARIDSRASRKQED